MYKKILISFILMMLILVCLYKWKTSVSEPIIVSDLNPKIASKTFEDKIYLYRF